MKKVLFNFLLPILILSCDCKNCGDHRNFVVTDFSKKRVDTLIPYENKTYVGYFIKVKGNVNDTIKIQTVNYGGHYTIPPGEIDTLLNADYYGTDTLIWAFDPYKATKGKLKIEYSL